MTELVDIEGLFIGAKKDKEVYYYRFSEDPIIYFSTKDLKLKEGIVYHFTVRKGEGDMAGCYEIMDIKPLIRNMALDKTPLQPGIPIPKAVTLSIDDFKHIIEDKSALTKSSSEALKLAVQLYSELAVRQNPKDIMSETIAEEVCKIACRFKKFLVG